VEGGIVVYSNGMIPAIQKKEMIGQLKDYEVEYGETIHG